MRSFNRLASYWAEVLWSRENPSSDQVKTLASRLNTLWPKLAKQRGQAKELQEHYSIDSRLAETYAAYYLPVNALKSTVVLDELSKLSYDFAAFGETLRWVDLGCGPGTVAWGLAEWVANGFGVPANMRVDYLGLDRSREFVSLASRGQHGLSTVSSRRVSARFRSSDLGLKKTKEIQDADVVSLFNCIAEIESDITRRTEFLFELCDQLNHSVGASSKPKLLIIVEPGSKQNSRELLEWRQKFIERASRFSHARILTPCMGARQCGALEKKDDWCHEAIPLDLPKWVNQIGEGAGLLKETLLFSYLVIEFSSQTPKAWPTGAYRVVSDLMKEKGRRECFLCTPEHGKCRARVLDSRRTDEINSFFELERSDLIESIELSEKGDVLKLGRTIGVPKLR